MSPVVISSRPEAGQRLASSSTFSLYADDIFSGSEKHLT